jgi:hypothetical protein
MQDIPLPPVTHRNQQIEPRIVFRLLFSLNHQSTNTRRERLTIADEANTNGMGMQFVHITLKCVSKQPHQGFHLFGRAGPVLRGEGKQR